MARDIDTFQLIRAFAERNGNLEIEYRVFSDAVRRQARLADQSAPVFRDLALNPDTVLVPRLLDLAKEKRLALEMVGNDIHRIILPERFESVFREEYRRMEENPEVPFPDEESLKIAVPADWIQAITLEADLGVVSERKPEEDRPPLYRLIFPESLRPLVIPASLVPDKLLEYAVLKIRLYLRRGGNRDYLYNKLLYSFSSKEMLLREAFGAVLTKPYDAVSEIRRSSSDITFPFWAYLATNIRKDIAKKNDKTAEDWSIVQAASICEFYANHYKSKAQRLLDLETAYKALDIGLRKAPWYFTIDDIAGFRDSKGHPLLSKYSREQLEERLREKTTKSDPGALPEILVIATGKGRRSYVAKEKILPLAVKLFGEGRAELRAVLLEEWRRLLEDFSQSPAMGDDAAFRAALGLLIEERLPFLDALIKGRYLPLVWEELRARGEEPSDLERYFYHGDLAPLDELLGLSRRGLLVDAKMLLPVWYGIPIISHLMRFFMRGSRGGSGPKAAKKSLTASFPEVVEDTAPKPNPASPADRRAEFSHAANAIAKVLVPSGYSLEEYLHDLEGRWNTMLNAQSKANLTEDVNSLVRDYLRSVTRTMRASAFTVERVKALAATLADSPNLLKIKNHQALEQYIQLYMVRILRR